MIAACAMLAMILDWGDARDALLLRAGLNTTSVVLGTTLLGLASGLIGSFAVLRQRALVGDAVAHATLPGVAAGFLIGAALGHHTKSLPLLLVCAGATGLLSLLAVHAITRRTRIREDAAIAMALSVFFGVGVVLLSVVQAMPIGQQAGLQGFIYGQTAGMLPGDVALIATLAGVVLVGSVLFVKEFSLVSFDREFAGAIGRPVAALDLLMMGLVLVVTIIGLQVVGMLLVVALLIIPPVAARFWTDRLVVLLALSGGMGSASGAVGAALSAGGHGLPTGALIVLVAGVLFLVSLIAAPRRGVLAGVIRQGRLRWRIAREHLLRRAYERTENTSGADGARDGWTGRGFPLVERAVLGVLARRGLIVRTGVRGEAAIVLTERGAMEAARIARNHQLWQAYLVAYADVAPSHVDWSADIVEHVLSPALVGELEGALARRGVRVTKASSAETGGAGK